MLQTDVEEMRARLEEKNRLIEKKTQGTLHTVQERNRLTSELTELKDHMDIKDRKISVLQRKVSNSKRPKHRHRLTKSTHYTHRPTDREPRGFA